MNEEEEIQICKNCEHEIPSRNMIIHNVHCQRNMILCKRCSKRIRKEDLQKHDEKMHSIKACTLCKEKMENYQLADHKLNICSKRNVSCKYCEIDMEQDKIGDHENYCGSRTEKCSDCGEFVMLKYQNLHLESNHGFLKLEEEKKEVKSSNNYALNSNSFNALKPSENELIPRQSRFRALERPFNYNDRRNLRESSSMNGLSSVESRSYGDVLASDQNSKSSKSTNLLTDRNHRDGVDMNGLYFESRFDRDTPPDQMLKNSKRTNLHKDKLQKNTSTMNELPVESRLYQDAFSDHTSTTSKKNNLHNGLEEFRYSTNYSLENGVKNLSINSKHSEKTSKKASHNYDFSSPNSLLNYEIKKSERNRPTNYENPSKIRTEDNLTINPRRNYYNQKSSMPERRNMCEMDNLEEFLKGSKPDLQKNYRYQFNESREPSTNKSHDKDSTYQLPCEFCSELFSEDDLILHQTGCRPDLVYSKKNTIKLPCEFCQAEFPAESLINHQTLCQFKQGPAADSVAPKRQPKKSSKKYRAPMPPN